jgi:hypothetical protein
MRTNPKSTFLRRLIRARDDPAKQRVLAWLMEIDDALLLTFGLTPGDIKILRAAVRPQSLASTKRRLSGVRRS